MINNDRIVPVTKTDLISLYSVILSAAGTSYVKQTGDVEGDFVLADSASGNLLADAPVKTIDFAGASAAVVYFVAGYDYEGIKIDGSFVTPSGVTVDKNCSSLYTATLATNAVTIAKVGL